MKKLFIYCNVILIISSAELCFEANAQSINYECFTSSQTLQPIVFGNTPSCNDFTNYIPNSASPTLTYKLRYHFFNNSDPNISGPFDFTADWPLIQAQIAQLNNTLANLQPPTLPVTPPAPLIPNSKIQFTLDPSSVFYYKDPLAWPMTSGSCQSILMNNYGSYNDQELDVFFYWTTAANGGCGPSNYVNMMSLAISNAQDFFSWATTQVLLHELGHSLGALNHTFVPQFDDVAVDFNYAWEECNFINISNNVMGYNKCRDYMSPKQIGYWHYQAYSGSTTKYLTACNYNSSNSIILNSDETWITTKIIGGDLIVEPGVTLTVKCGVFMPLNGKVIVKPNARLIIDGGVFSNACGEYWEGIEVWGNKNQNQFPSNHPL